MTRLILIGCVAQKADRPMAAKDIYTSNLFAARRAYAEASGCPWGIVSARRGQHILAPDTVIEPYDRRMAALSPRSREQREMQRQWELDAGTDAHQVFGAAMRGAVVEVHAGAEYVASLRAALLDRFGCTIEVPLLGLFIGQQLAWYKARRAS